MECPCGEARRLLEEGGAGPPDHPPNQESHTMQHEFHFHRLRLGGRPVYVAADHANAHLDGQKVNGVTYHAPTGQIRRVLRKRGEA